MFMLSYVALILSSIGTQCIYVKQKVPKFKWATSSVHLVSRSYSL